MKTKKRLIIIALLSLILAVNISLGQTAKELLPKAIQLEEVKGELEEAIKVYQTIVKDFAGEREIAAKAQLHIGLCYEKLGKKQASEAYNKVIKQFADQQQTAEIAKTRLQYLNSMIASVDKNAAPPTVKQIVLDRKLILFLPHFNRRYSYEFSPDGENFVFTSYSDDSRKGIVLYTANLAGPPSKRLITPSVFEREAVPRYLPDGEHIVFRGFGKDQSWRQADFYFVSAAGGKHGQYTPKTITFSPNDKYIIKDNKLIAKSFLSDSTNWFSLFSSDFVSPVNLKVSPNSKWISFNTRMKSENRNEADCFLVSTSGDTYIRLTDSKGFDGFGTWSEKNNFFYFVSERYGDRNIFRLKINPETGKKIGTAEQITFYKDADVFNPCFIEKKNALTYCLSKKIPEIVISENENFNSFKTIATGTHPVMSPDENTVYFIGTGKDNQGIYSVSRTGGATKRLTNLVPFSYYSLSPDGSTIAFFTKSIDEKQELHFLATNSGKIFNSTKIEYIDWEIYPTWSPDSKSVAFGYEKGLYITSTWGKKTEKIAEFDIGYWESWTPRWSPDGKFIAGLYTDLDKDGENDVVLISVKNGDKKRLTTKEEGQYKEALKWYPDSKKLSYMYYDPDNDNDGLREAYIDGSPTTEMIDQPYVWDYWGKWDPFGENYYFWGNTMSATNLWHLYKYNAETKKIKLILADNPGDSYFSFSKNGKYMVFSRQETENQLWLMEGVE